MIDIQTLHLGFLAVYFVRMDGIAFFNFEQYPHFAISTVSLIGEMTNVLKDHCEHMHSVWFLSTHKQSFKYIYVPSINTHLCL